MIRFERKLFNEYLEGKTPLFFVKPSLRKQKSEYLYLMSGSLIKSYIKSNAQEIAKRGVEVYEFEDNAVLLKPFSGAKGLVEIRRIENISKDIEKDVEERYFQSVVVDFYDTVSSELVESMVFSREELYTDFVKDVLEEDLDILMIDDELEKDPVFIISTRDGGLNKVKAFINGIKVNKNTTYLIY